MSKDRNHQDSMKDGHGYYAYTMTGRIVRVHDPWLDADEAFRPPDMGERDGTRDNETGDDEAHGSPVRLSTDAAREICPGR